LAGPNRRECSSPDPQDPVSSSWPTIVFEARAYISYNLKFVY
jgi:hypothetical protein